MEDAVLWLWLFILPATIGLFVGTWFACLCLASAYLVLFDLDTAIVAIGSARLAEIMGPIAADDLMIAVVALSCHGLRQEFLRAG